MCPFKSIIYLKYRADLGYFVVLTVNLNKGSNITEFFNLSQYSTEFFIWASLFNLASSTPSSKNQPQSRQHPLLNTSQKTTEGKGFARRFHHWGMIFLHLFTFQCPCLEEGDSNQDLPPKAVVSTQQNTIQKPFSMLPSSQWTTELLVFERGIRGHRFCQD